ncbi:MAG TPA: hypothetical protein VNX28_14360 [Gemmataceae bacterium]|jgi:hypothetical protein|nr:hypothetical protein [Gemmataceae bacterium]
MIFTSNDVQARLHEQPFVPMRIVTTTGQTYDIFHPDLVFVAKRFLIVGIPGADDPSLADQVTRIALVHLAELRDLPSSAPPSNGVHT